MSIKKTFLILSVLVLFTFCKKNKFKVKNFLPALYSNKIEPELLALNDEITSVSVEFIDISTSISDQNIDIFRKKFKLLLENAESASFYNFGDISDIYVFSRFYKTSMDTTKLWAYYDSKSFFNQDGISSQTNNIKGLTAIEYLLFQPNSKDSLITSSKYLNFLDAQLKAAKKEMGNILFSWSVYETNFVDMTEDGVNGSYNMVVNQIVHGFEEVIKKTMSNPLINSENFSKSRLNLIRASVKHKYDIFMGNGTIPFNSIYNNTRKKNRKLANQVQEDFENLIIEGDELVENYDTYFYQNSVALVNYRNSIERLMAKFKIDVMVELGVTLTLSDSDGD
jgi:predicted lipoprotein